jgi:predicted DNA-binding WGR domain protein
MKHTSVPVHSWHLEFIGGTSKKFYRVLVTEAGLTILRWGRIGSVGQHSVSSFGMYDKARDVGLRQVFEKKAKGYVEKYHDLKFSASADAINDATDGDFTLIDREWREAADAGEFDAAKVEVLKHYADFSERVQVLLDRAADADLDTTMDEYESLSGVWDEINDKHAEVTAAMGLCRATLMQKLVGA